MLGPDYPSETFRVHISNQIKRFGEYRTECFVLDAWNRMERGDLPAPYDRNTVPAATAIQPPFALPEDDSD